MDGRRQAGILTAVRRDEPAEAEAGAHRFVATAPDRSGSARRRSDRRAEEDAEGRKDPPYWIVGSVGEGHRERGEDSENRQRTEQIQHCGSHTRRSTAV